jgi:hypothetical protein
VHWRTRKHTKLAVFAASSGREPGLLLVISASIPPVAHPKSRRRAAERSPPAGFRVCRSCTSGETLVAGSMS